MSKKTEVEYINIFAQLNEKINKGKLKEVSIVEEDKQLKFTYSNSIIFIDVYLISKTNLPLIRSAVDIINEKLGVKAKVEEGKDIKNKIKDAITKIIKNTKTISKESMDDLINKLIIKFNGISVDNNIDLNTYFSDVPDVIKNHDMLIDFANELAKCTNDSDRENIIAKYVEKNDNKILAINDYYKTGNIYKIEENGSLLNIENIKDFYEGKFVDEKFADEQVKKIYNEMNIKIENIYTINRDEDEDKFYSSYYMNYMIIVEKYITEFLIYIKKK